MGLFHRVDYNAAALTVLLGAASLWLGLEAPSSRAHRESMYALRTARDALRTSSDLYSGSLAARDHLTPVRQSYRDARYVRVEKLLEEITSSNRESISASTPLLQDATRDSMVLTLQACIEQRSDYEWSRKGALVVLSGMGSIITAALGVHTYFLFRGRNKRVALSRESKPSIVAVQSDG